MSRDKSLTLLRHCNKIQPQSQEQYHGSEGWNPLEAGVDYGSKFMANMTSETNEFWAMQGNDCEKWPESPSVLLAKLI